MPEVPKEESNGDDIRPFESRRIELFLKELASILQSEEEGELKPESVTKLKTLLKDYWKIKLENEK